MNAIGDFRELRIRFGATQGRFRRCQAVIGVSGNLVF